MINLFTSCGDIASVGIIVDFAEDVETYVVGNPVDIKEWVYSGCPKKAENGIMLHSNKVGNLVKDINRLMKIKYELDEIVDLRDKLCDANMLCDGTCNSVIDELSQFYDYSEYANIVKNYIIYFLYSKFKIRQKEFNKKVGLSVKGNHDRAEKYIELFKADSEKILRSFLFARAEKSFNVTSAVKGQTDIFDSNVYKNSSATLYVANDSFITLLDIYADNLRFGRIAKEVYMDDYRYKALQNLTRARFFAVQNLTKEKQRFLNYLFMKFSTLKSDKVFSDIFGNTSLSVITEFMSVDEIAVCDFSADTLTGTIAGCVASTLTGCSESNFIRTFFRRL